MLLLLMMTVLCSRFVCHGAFIYMMTVQLCGKYIICLDMILSLKLSQYLSWLRPGCVFQSKLDIIHDKEETGGTLEKDQMVCYGMVWNIGEGPNGMLWYGMLWNIGEGPNGMLWYGMLWNIGEGPNGMVCCGMEHWRRTKCHVMLWYGTLEKDQMVWYGTLEKDQMVWYGMEHWRRTKWYGMVWNIGE